MMKRWGVSVVVLWVLAGFLSGCGSEETLPRVRYGEDMCANCRMIINDPQCACVVETADGEFRKYDDFNCMFLDVEREKLTPKRYLVPNYAKPDEWLDGTQAYYVRADDLQTPMGSRVLALPSQEQAEAEAKRLNGKVLRFEEVRKSSWGTNACVLGRDVPSPARLLGLGWAQGTIGVLCAPGLCWRLSDAPMLANPRCSTV